MSRSHRYHPITGMAGGKSHSSEKWDKRKANRRLRHSAKIKLAQDKELPLLREVSDTYVFFKDGKFFFSRYQWKDEPWYNRLMRK